MIKIISYVNSISPSFMDAVKEFENSIEKSDEVDIVNNNICRIKSWIIRNYLLFTCIPIFQKNIFFSMIMGIGFYNCWQKFFFQKNKVIYMFDAWPNTHKYIEKYILKNKIKIIFFSSKATTLIFREKKLDTKIYWIPEAIDISSYKHYDTEEKNIDVLQFGRKYNLVHDAILSNTKSNNFNYIYAENNKMLFSTRESFIEGLARSKICLCFPANLTHPEKAGNVSTMTIRYLQAMASKCLVVGVVPDEMKELFDYDSILELDLKNPYEHLENIIKTYNDYIPLIEKNYQYVRKYHTWKVRWEKMKEIMIKEL